MAKIVSFGDFRNAVYSINISNEERELLRTSAEGMRLIQECNMNRGVFKRSTLSDLSDGVNKELQRLRSLAHGETRLAHLEDAEVRRTQGLASRGSRK